MGIGPIVVSPNVAEEGEGRFTCVPPMEVEFGREVADAAANGRIGSRPAEEEALARRGPDEVQQHTNRGCLSCPVGAEESEDFALFDFEIERINRT
jgi:hypothetical protein